MAIKIISYAIIKFKLFDYEFDDFERFYNHILRITSVDCSNPPVFDIVKKVDPYGANIKVYSENEKTFMQVFNNENIKRLKIFAKKTFTFPPTVIIDKQRVDDKFEKASLLSR